MSLLRKLERKVDNTPYSEREMGLDWELFGILAQVDGRISFSTIKQLAAYDSQGHLIQLLLSKRTHKHHRQWCESGVFHPFFQTKDNAVMSKLVDVMIETGADLNDRSNIFLVNSEEHWRYRLIDAVARRGDLMLMQRLLDANALLSVDTLSYAIDSGNEDLVRFLIEQGANINGEDDCYICPLAAAIRLQQKSMVDLVFGHMDEKALRVSHVFISTWRVAVEIRSMEWVQKLLAVSADMDPIVLGQALSIAIAHSMREVAFELIDAGADVNCLAEFCSLLFTVNTPKPLELALKQQDSGLVWALFETGVRLHASRNRSDITNALELAVSWGDLDIIQHLMALFARSGRVPFLSSTALKTAFQRRNYKLMDILMEAGIKYGLDSYGETALAAAIQTDDVEIVRYVLERGADPYDSRALLKALDQSSDVLELLIKEYAKRYPRGRSGWGASALKAAIHRDNLPLFERLLAVGADPLASRRSEFDVWSDDDMITPFRYAINREESSGLLFVEHLLQANGSACTPEAIVGLDFSLRSNYTYPETSYYRTDKPITAMLAAIGTKNRNMVELMLRYGADVNHPATYGITRTPLQMATEVGSMELIKLLLQKGADVNGAPAKRGGSTAIQLAAINGHISIARLLLEKGARIDQPPSPYCMTALEGAAANGRLDMVALVLSAWASVSSPNLGPSQKQLASATALADERGYYYISSMLKQYMATGKVGVFDPETAKPDVAEPDVFELFDFAKYSAEAGA